MHYCTRNFIWPGSFIQNQNRLQFKVLSALSFSLRLPKPWGWFKSQNADSKKPNLSVFFHGPLLKVYETIGIQEASIT